MPFFVIREAAVKGTVKATPHNSRLAA